MVVVGKLLLLPPITLRLQRLWQNLSFDVKGVIWMLGQHRTMAARLVGNGWGIAGQELHIVPCSFSFSLRRQLEMRVKISNFSVFIDCSDFYASSRLTLTKVSWVLNIQCCPVAERFAFFNDCHGQPIEVSECPRLPLCKDVTSVDCILDGWGCLGSL